MTYRTDINLTINQASDLLRQKKLSPVDLTEACLDRIDRLNPTLNAFITITRESAIAEAETAEHELHQGDWRGPLHGIPIGLKDLIDTAGVKTTCGSALFAERVPAEDAEIVQRLKRAGAIIVGKQNLQEFAWGGTSASSHYGPVHNPWDVERIAGGSSGGSAAAVAAGMCFAAIGTDTGGSIREPAAFCGIVGLKPTYGRVSTCGVFPLSWSLDHVGPICRSVADAALMLEVIAGYNPSDFTSVDCPTEKYAEFLGVSRKLRIGVARQLFFDELDPEIRIAIENAIKVIGGISSDIAEVELPDVPTTVQAPEVFAIHQKYFDSSPELYRKWMRERLKQATAIDTVSYIHGVQEIQRVRRSISDVFEKVDLVVTPTTPVPPITIAEALEMSLPGSAGELWLRNTRPFNVYGIPTISIPCGFTFQGLPIGLQIAGPHFNEGRVLAFAHAFEQATEWHTRGLNL
jgi:aspartyl-tRNA(Asn)/glutamyl-tRNA(Gln) amidotransferase subunit A